MCCLLSMINVSSRIVANNSESSLLFSHYTACMDFIDLTVLCLQKTAKYNHSLAAPCPKEVVKLYYSCSPQISMPDFLYSIYLFFIFFADPCPSPWWKKLSCATAITRLLPSFSSATVFTFHEYPKVMVGNMHKDNIDNLNEFYNFMWKITTD